MAEIKSKSEFEELKKVLESYFGIINGKREHHHDLHIAGVSGFLRYRYNDNNLLIIEDEDMAYIIKLDSYNFQVFLHRCIVAQQFNFKMIDYNIGEKVTKIMLSIEYEIREIFKDFKFEKPYVNKIVKNSDKVEAYYLEESLSIFKF